MKKCTVHQPVKEIIPDEELLQELGKTLVSSYMEIIYKPHYNKYKIFCTQCMTEQLVDSNKFKQIKYSKICPNCFREIYQLRETEEKNKPNVFSGNVQKCNDGFYVTAKQEFGKDLKFSAFHSMHIRGNKRFVRNIKVFGIGYYSMSLRMLIKDWYPKLWDRWRKTSSYNYERLSFQTKLASKWLNEPIQTKRQYLEKNAPFMVKSNQIKLAIDNLFNESQLKTIVYFDLKNPNDVYKYRVWIKNNKDSIGTVQTYNVSTLKYLWKNKIHLSDYNDYAEVCRQNGRKPDKPTDFQLWHDRQIALKEVKRNASNESGVKKQYKKLSKYNVENKKYTIKTFSDIEEICWVSASLHNCMSRLYTEPFAKGKTELWYLAVNGKPIIAIEYNKGRLIQCRGDNNFAPPAKYKRYVTEWAKNRRLEEAI